MTCVDPGCGCACHIVEKQRLPDVPVDINRLYLIENKGRVIIAAYFGQELPGFYIFRINNPGNPLFSRYDLEFTREQLTSGDVKLTPLTTDGGPYYIMEQ